MISKPVKHQILTLGEQISKFTFPEEFTDVINRAYDNDKKSLPGWNQELVGKIQSEHNVNQIINDQLKKIFMACFQQYITSLEKGEILLKSQTLKLGDAWINEMYSGEYNPAHYHQGKKSLVGLSSVLFLKVPSTYGREYSREDVPANGVLEFIGGQQHALAVSQKRVRPKVGDFYVFPYSLIHTVYPFRDTPEARRTLSYNCDIVQKIKQKEEPKWQKEPTQTANPFAGMKGI
tara:strand:+ start:303 stop:1004 length:702 start_codon:yes stop_codon:yes gene_type:complete